MLPRISLLNVSSLITLVWFGTLRVSAQTSNAHCLPQFGWMNNSLGQDPCLIAAYVQQDCSDSTWTVDSLPSDRHYVGPTADEANPCQCSSVVYSLVSACACCQGDQWETWSLWKYNCSAADTSVAEFPLPVPYGTVIPGYAFYDPTTNSQDTFNVTQAQALDVNPEATPPQTSSTYTGPTGTLGSPVPSQSESGSGGSSTPIGAIVGGVVGGIVGLGLLAALIVFLVLRHKKKTAPPSAQWDTSMHPDAAAAQWHTKMHPRPAPPPPRSPYQASHSPAPLLARSGNGTMPIYNPDDPSTWPTTTSSPVHTHTTGQTPSSTYTTAAQPNYGRYPEL